VTSDFAKQGFLIFSPTLCTWFAQMHSLICGDCTCILEKSGRKRGKYGCFLHTVRALTRCLVDNTPHGLIILRRLVDIGMQRAARGENNSPHVCTYGSPQPCLDSSYALGRLRNVRPRGDEVHDVRRYMTFSATSVIVAAQYKFCVPLSITVLALLQIPMR
jgi:hypothetical protein